ncbi:hypothetical protein ACLBWP_08060 [Microbacterium sp. M1A1_1b]
MCIELVSTGAGMDAASAAQVRRSADRGVLVRVRRGHFADATQWNGASARDRHAALVRAVDWLPGSGLVVSHRSAVALHGLPWIGAFGDHVIVTDPSRDRGQSKGVIRRVGTAGRIPDMVLLSGVATTSLVVTAVDVALSEHP